MWANVQPMRNASVDPLPTSSESQSARAAGAAIAERPVQTGFDRRRSSTLAEWQVIRGALAC